MARKRPSEGDEAHDVLAAEEFPPPAGADADTVEARAHRLPPDPSGERGPHDVLAAEEFPAPATADADTVMARAHRLPPDPSGEASAHDVLAAEEWPPPAHADVSPFGLDPGSPTPGWRPAAFALGAALGVLVVLRRLRG
jgi:hypothetical protein